MALRRVTERLVSAHQAGSRLALRLDYDGTLTPIVEHPALALLEPHTRRLLERLTETPRVSVGVFSGRGLVDLRHLVALPDLFYAGSSGLELDLRGTRTIHPKAVTHRRHLEVAAATLAALARDYPGAWVEDTHLGWTLHYRQVDARQVEELLERAGRALRAYAGMLRVTVGLMAWEVTPDVGWHKGSALRLIVESLGPCLPFYAGDAANDTEALATAAVLGGIAVGVGPAAPPARYHMAGPTELVAFLSGLAEALRLETRRPIAVG
jgi:trehalose 6-phosphate phosphatase